jgi:hypothetical protein
VSCAGDLLLILLRLDMMADQDARFDRNNDARITLDEMRESEDGEDVRQHDPLKKQPILTPIVSRNPKNEL